MKCPRCGYEWESKVPSPKECPRCKVRLDYVPGPVGAPKIGKKGGVKEMTTKLWATAAVIIIAAAIGAWAIWGQAAAPPITPPAPGWSPIVGYVPGQGGIIAVYCVKTTTNLATNPSTWGPENYYVKIIGAGTMNVPVLTNFYVVVEARGQKPYIVGANADNIKVELNRFGDVPTVAENKTGTSGTLMFSWSAAEGAENIRVSAVFDNNGGAVDNPFYLSGDQVFSWTAKVWQYY